MGPITMLLIHDFDSVRKTSKDFFMFHTTHELSSLRGRKRAGLRIGPNDEAHWNFFPEYQIFSITMFKSNTINAALEVIF